MRDRVSGKVDPEDFARETVLETEEELGLVEHAEQCARLGYGYSNMEMKKLAGELAFKLGRRKRDKPLSNCWLYGFLGRWRERLSTLKPSALDSNRAKNTTPEAVQTYFHNLKNTIDTLHLENRPDLIFNMDETGISPEHRPPNIIAPSNEKPHSVTSPRSTTTTLIACANAAGSNIPPYFVFKGEV